MIWWNSCFELRVVAILAVLLISACSDSSDRPAPQYVAWKAAQAVTSTEAGRGLGEACTLGGLQCASHLCLHYAEPDKRVCTKFCESETDCPPTWACQPSGGNPSACVPAESFQAHRVEVAGNQAP